MTNKLSILVHVDFDHAKAQVVAKGHVTIHSIQALFVVVKRANALRHNLVLELDMRNARVDPDALRQLLTCSEARFLPVRIDPQQTPCTLSILPPRHALHTAHQLHAAHHTPARLAA
ncbi:hypothetical protein [Pseudarthrobacter sulfonivorans]|uniref:hypothetical protein n=1 Tax=Pseudarthrobacter sulfonivorans TaxID=121292 RepID=UPI0021061FC3|nr:hypothetical protein [Pseudarthrobacter sulfonivorans]